MKVVRGQDGVHGKEGGYGRVRCPARNGLHWFRRKELGWGRAGFLYWQFYSRPSVAAVIESMRHAVSVVIT